MICYIVMLELKKSNRKLGALILTLSGAVMLIGSVIWMTQLGNEDIPPIEANPGLSSFLLLVCIAGMGLVVSGGIRLFVRKSGFDIFINSVQMFETKAFNSNYASIEADGLASEIKQKLHTKKFKQLGEDTQAFWRSSTQGIQAFSFAGPENLGNADALIERVDNIWRGVTQSKESNRIADVDIILFFPMQQVSNEQIISLVNLRKNITSKTKAIVTLCLYDLSGKRVYTTIYETNTGQGASIERNGALIQNLSAGANRMEIFIAAGQSKLRAQETREREATFNEINPTQNNLGSQDEFRLNVGGGLFWTCVISCGVLLVAFGILLAIWLTMAMMDAMLFFYLFVPLLLMPGLALFYFSLATHKKIVIRYNQLTIKRAFGDIEVFSQPLEYAERFKAGGMFGSKKVFAIFPKDTALDSDMVFTANNYRKYVLVSYSDYNRAVLEKILVRRA
ncbi:MAG: hypothetical protein FWE31_01110 [Firmicutes bacterium]|nr:hypothetical protein [Bacillota bacterium]